jgi:hypothetical protein
MDFDDIVIGSGLAALGATLGIAANRKVLVIGNPLAGQFHFYDDRKTVPCAYTGMGGLGNDWHGVIPTGWRNNFGNASREGYTDLLKYFYPKLDLSNRVQAPWLFVPWRSIRPQAQFIKLKAQRGDNLTILNDTALKIAINSSGASVTTATQTFNAKHIWVAAGALQTPGVLEKSFGQKFDRGVVSDHAFCYIGQVANAAKPELTHGREGIFFPARYDQSGQALYTLRPARFAFRQLDFGIEQRAVFGLPTGNAVAKIVKRASPGLFAEAFFNRFGLFGGASMHSVYAQVVARDAYEFAAQDRLIKARPQALKMATDSARANQPFAELVPSRLPDAIIPGIHLHHSIDRKTLAQAGLDCAGSSVQVVDASTIENIGADHHSFKMMLNAFDRVKQTHAAV